MNISTVSPSTCDIRFSLQNRHAGDRLATALGKLGVSNSAVTISGRATRSEKTISEAEFVGADAAAIRATLTRFLTEHELPCANDLVILDMEPQRFAPRNLGDFEGRQQRDLVAAYRRRIRVARDVLRRKGVPGVRLGMYQVIVPDGRGRFTDEFERSMCGYLEAGRQGMYDELDFICPVLYQRFGPDDTTPETLRAWVAASTRQAIEGSLSLTRRSGARIPLVPILSFWVFNGGSANKRQAVSPDSVARQLEAVQQANGIATILFWSGWQTEHEMESAAKPVEPIDIYDFLVSVGTLPWRGCDNRADVRPLATC
jgi:hypothetical protein